MTIEQHKPEVTPPYGYYPEDEIDLSQIFGVLWRRRWWILGTMVFLFGLAILYCAVATKKYLISAQISPGITGYNMYRVVRNLKPKDLQSWFTKKAYLTVLASTLPEDLFKKVKIDASTPRGSNVVALEFYWPDKAQGEKILKTVIDSLSSLSRERLNKSLKVSESMLEEAIKKKKNALEQVGIMQDKLNRDIELERDNLALIKDAVQIIEQKIEQTKAPIDDLEKEVKDINRNTQDLIKLRNELARNPKADKFSVLMYTNIIQQNMSYAIELRKNITRLRKSVFDLELEKKNKETELKKVLDKIKTLEEKRDKELPLEKSGIESEIRTLVSQKDSLSPVEVVQHPFSSLRPVKPKTPLILAVSLVIGGLLGIFCAFIVEFIETNREKILDQKR